MAIMLVNNNQTENKTMNNLLSILALSLCLMLWGCQQQGDDADELTVDIVEMDNIMNIGVGAKAPGSAEVYFDGTREMLDEKS